MDLHHLASIGLQPIDSHVSLWHTQDHDERFFVLKAKNRDPIDSSQLSRMWALRAHLSCKSGDQPHERLASARRSGKCSVILLFAENSEHAWVGYATMESDPTYAPDEVDFPYVFTLSWQVCLPHAQGVCFGAVQAADCSHKVFNADEIPRAAGHTIRATITGQLRGLKQREIDSQKTLLDSAFILQLPGETEIEMHWRLLKEVEQRLGPVLVACSCGSRHYNLHFPSSDHDLLVVYVAKDSQIVQPAIKNPNGLHPDYTLVEVARFVELLTEGDPRMVESLFLHAGESSSAPAETEPSVLSATPLWKELVEMRGSFISKSLVHKYLGDATGRAGLLAIRKNIKIAKHRKMLYVAFRTLENALQACRGQPLQVWRPSGGEEYEFLMALRRGENGEVSDLVQRAEIKEKTVRRALKECELVEKPQADIVEPWLFQARAWCRQVLEISRR